MAENKKSFILYCDYSEIFNDLSNSDAGDLVKHIFSYMNDETHVTDNPVVKASVIAIKLQLKRDLKRWDDIREKRSVAGKRSAEVRQQTSTNSTSVKSVEQTSTNSTVTVNDTDTVTVNVSTKVDSIAPIEKIDWDSLLSVFNSIFGKGAKVINANTKQKFNARIKDGWKKTDIRQAMEVVKNDTFHKDSNFKHVTIEYFSRDKTLQMYANEPIKRLPIDRQPITFDY